MSNAIIDDYKKLRDILNATSTASDVWAGGAYRSQENEDRMIQRDLKKPIHSKAC